MKKYLKFIVFLSFFLAIFLSFGNSFVKAVETPPPPTSGDGAGVIKLPSKPPGIPDVSVDGVVNTAIKLIFVVGQVAFVLVLLISGVMLITSAGNEQNVEKAKKGITFAVIGIVVLFSAWGMASFIVNQLK